MKRSSGESKVIIAFNNESDIREAELYSEVAQLKEKLTEYKMIHLEDIQYKDIVDKLMQKGHHRREWGKDVILKSREECNLIWRLCIL